VNTPDPRRPHAHCRRPDDTSLRRAQSFWRRWLVANSLISGTLALCWVALRSGTRPNRLAYPCQQAALSTATLALGGPLVAGLLAIRRRVLLALRRPVGLVSVGCGVFVLCGLWGYWSWAGQPAPPRLNPPGDYRAQLYHVVNCPQEPVGDRFVGIDNLITLMGCRGLKFHNSPNESLTAGPDGIIAADDVVIIKINYQWPERGGSNVDLLSGLIRWIVDHPDGFAGEIVVCENTQFASTDRFDRDANNAQDHTRSPRDVVESYQSAGWRISLYNWRLVRRTQVSEYSDGDLNDGYVVYDYDPDLRGRISYPKFRSDPGTYISTRFGLWDPVSGEYDRAHLKFINVPVLKSHHATYGVTACVKNYMGVVSGELNTNSHSAIRYGILGALLGEIRPADLNILDCVWINANPYTGPQTPYSGATRRDMLVAGTDPVAADIWATVNILIPAFLENGHTPPWPEPSADPNDPGSDFRQYLDNSLSYILAAGYPATNDLTRIDSYTWDGLGDINLDGRVDLADLAQLLAHYGATGGVDYYDGDLDQDGDVDLTDLATLLSVYATGCP